MSAAVRWDADWMKNVVGQVLTSGESCVRVSTLLLV